MGPESNVEGDEHRVEEVDEHPAHHGDGEVGHGEGPYFLVTTCILAMALEVAPMEKPMKSAVITAAS